jgi:transposase
MNVRYRVELSQVERSELTAMLSKGKRAARKLKRAQILLAADAGRGDEEIARTVAVSGSTVYRIKRRFVEGNLERALSEEPRPGADRKLTGKEEALLVATACASPPEGRARWTLELLADAMVKLTDHESLSGETVRRRLAENDLKPWRKDMWCIPKVDGEYVARMEDVLDLYAEAPDPQRPVVCFDESPVQLIGEVRQPIPAEPGQLERYDCEYRRNGTVNLFVCIDVNRPGARSRSPRGGRQKITPIACANSSMSIIPTPHASAWCRITCRPTRPAHSTRPLRLPRPGESCAASSSTTPPSMPVGSTWLRSRSACCAASASTAESTTKTGSAAKSTPGNDNETPPEPVSIGCSQSTKPAPKWATPILSHPTSHNHCGEVLALLWQIIHAAAFRRFVFCSTGIAEVVVER